MALLILKFYSKYILSQIRVKPTRDNGRLIITRNYTFCSERASALRKFLAIINTILLHELRLKSNEH